MPEHEHVSMTFTVRQDPSFDTGLLSALIGTESLRLLAELEEGADVPDLARTVHEAMITDFLTNQNRALFGSSEPACTPEDARTFLAEVEALRADEEARKASWKTAPSRLAGPVRACKDIPDHVLLAAVAVAMDVRERRGEFDESFATQVRTAFDLTSAELGISPKAPTTQSQHWATRWDVAAVLMGDHARVGGAPVVYPDLPEKVLLAKLGKLKARGWVDCCACGCRGDIALTHLVPFAPSWCSARLAVWPQAGDITLTRWAGFAPIDEEHPGHEALP